jgi:DNA polymerase-3 subunit beta
MRCTVDTTLFVSTLQEAQRFVANKALNPTLSGIVVETGDNTLFIKSSNGQALYQCQIPAEIEEAGTVLLPASIVVSSVKSLEKGNLTLSTENTEAIITQGKVKFSLSPLPFDSFPTLPDSPPTHTFLLPLEQFFAAAEKVVLAASRDESKPVLTSLLIEMAQPNALVTSDGFRLYRIETDLSLDVQDQILLPAKYIRELSALVKKTKETVLTANWYSDNGFVVFSLGSVQLQVSVVQGEFPNYRGIIPAATSFAVTLDRELFLQRLQQVLVVAKEVSSIVIFEEKDGELALESQASVHGKSSSSLPALQKEGETPRFACNGSYLLEFLQSIDEPEVCLQGVDPLKPIICTIPGKKEVLYLVMPFKLQS